MAEKLTVLHERVLAAMLSIREAYGASGNTWVYPSEIAKILCDVSANVAGAALRSLLDGHGLVRRKWVDVPTTAEGKAVRKAQYCLSAAGMKYLRSMEEKLLTSTEQQV